jgi:hypothetical protein
LFRSLDEIGEFLRREVHICNQQHEGARAAFWRFAAGVRDPKHDPKVEFAASLVANSSRSLLAALARFNSFLSTGIIPEGLELHKPQPTEQGSARVAGLRVEYPGGEYLRSRLRSRARSAVFSAEWRGAEFPAGVGRPETR